MVSTPALFDTVILVDYLRGIRQARVECDRHADRAVSIITWMEVLVGVADANQADTRAFLSNFQILPLTKEVVERAVMIRRASRIKLPDAIIQATAQLAGRILITHNTRDFPSGTAGVRVPYKI